VKVNELAELTGVGIETIRKYRNEGLLFPEKRPNGYYEYGSDDLVRLLYIRKLRGSGLSLASIRYSCEYDDREAIYDTMRRESDELAARIAELTMRRRILEMTLQHFDACKAEDNAVSEWQVSVDSCCIPLAATQTDEDARQWLSHVELTAQNMILDTAALQEGALPDKLPYTYGLASYVPVLNFHRIPIPADAVLIPAGRYLALWLSPEEPGWISARQLQPLLDYAAARGYRFTGRNSGFIYRIQRENGQDRFCYRFRAQVETPAGAPEEQSVLHLDLPCS